MRSHRLYSRRTDLGDILNLNYTLLLVIATYAIVVIRKVRAMHVTQKLFVVSNHNQLKVALLATCADDLGQRFCQGANVGLVEIRGRLVKRNQTAIDSETFCKCLY